MVQPPGFHSGTTTSAVCQLKKSLYGLKQAPRAWNAKITQQLRQMGFATSKSDSSLFIRKGRLDPVSILLYVDDLIITGADLVKIDRVTLQLAASFNMKDLGDLHYFLGIEVIRTPEGILISQRHYVLSMLFKFGMADIKSVSTPLDRTVKLLSRLWKGMRSDEVSTNCRKPHILDHHSTRPQLSGRGDQ